MIYPLVILALSACAPAVSAPTPDINALVQHGLQTAQAEQTQQAAPGQPTAAEPAGMAANLNPVSFPEFHTSLSFVYPPGFQHGLQTDVLPARAIQNPGDLEYPAHARVIFTGYAGDSRDNTAFGIRVFRVADINAMDASLLEDLRANLAGTSSKHRDFPKLPGAALTVDAQAKSLDFQSGKGYRFLAAAQFGANSLSSTQLTYIYQGLTTDDQYLVTVLLPVDAPFISDLITDQAFTSDQEMTTYLDTLNSRIDAAQPGDFSPSLDMYDSLVQSLAVHPQ